MTEEGIPAASRFPGSGQVNSADLALNWVLEQAAVDRWNLPPSELCTLLGISGRQLESWCNSDDRANLSLPEDVLERIGCLFRLDCILSIVMPPLHRFDAFNLPSSQASFFSGLSIRDYLLASPLTPRFYSVCNYLQGHVVLGRPLDIRHLN